MEKFIKVIESVSEYSGRYISFLIVPLILTIVYSVIVRYFLNGMVHWAFEMSLFMHGLLVMIGGAYTLKHKAHVRVDILAHYLGNRGRFYLDLLSFLVIIAVCVVITWLGSKSAWTSTLRLERSSLQTPFDPQIWWYKWAIPVSATLIGLQAAVEAVKVCCGIDDEPQESA